MEELMEVTPASAPGRVRAISDDGCCLYVELKSGGVATIRSSAPLDFSVGTVVLIREADNHIESAPEDVWPEESWAAVVRIRLPDLTVLDSNGRWKIVPTPSAPDYVVGNTVEAKDSAGVMRVLSRDPIRFFELPTVDNEAIGKFKVAAGTQALTFDDFGGLPSVVERARQLIETRMKHTKALGQIGARPIKGVLFTGPPGTGKTMLARVIASQTKSAFYEISGPEIFSKWYGQSEEILRSIFESAAKEDSAIIFFDEIDSVASQREEEAHEASRRVVAQLLTLMDGFQQDDRVVVIAATNRPQDIDGALRRPGRFDWEIHFPLPDERDREEIMRVSARKLATNGPLPHGWVAEHTAGWSGAELTAIWSEAALLAAEDGRAAIMAEDYIGGYARVAAQLEQNRHRLTPAQSR